MKIDPEMHQLEIAAASKPNAANKQDGANFSDLLAQAVGESEQTDGAEKLAGPVLDGGGTGLPPLWHQVNGLLDQMEVFGQALGDKGMTLKDIEPLAEELEQRAGDMGKSLDTNGDASLQELAKSALAQAQAEVIKFRRGDYV